MKPSKALRSRSPRRSSPQPAVAVLAGCHHPEMQRCVDEQNRVVAQQFCANLPPQGSYYGGGGPVFIPYHYYYGGGGGWMPGSVVYGGSSTYVFRPQLHHPRPPPRTPSPAPVAEGFGQLLRWEQCPQQRRRRIAPHPSSPVFLSFPEQSCFRLILLIRPPVPLIRGESLAHRSSKNDPSPPHPPPSLAANRRAGRPHLHTPPAAMAPQPYWDESAAYQFTAAEVDTLEAARQRAPGDVPRRRPGRHRPQALRRARHPARSPSPAIEAAWNAEPPGAFTAASTSAGQARAVVSPPSSSNTTPTTPTSLLEAAVIQWSWLEDVQRGVPGANIFHKADQFNSIHDPSHRQVEGHPALPAGARLLPPRSNLPIRIRTRLKTF